jgi:acyl carrier protein
MNTIERFAKLTSNKQSLLAVWLDQHKNGSGDAADANKQLVAYVVMKNGGRDTAPLRQYLKGRTPAYMVPDTFVSLDTLPLTTNGKIDRARLAELAKTDRQSDDTFVAPRTELEEELASIWVEILKVEHVGINDNFFDAGGNSLLVVQVQHKLQEATGSPISIVELFMHPTVRSLAAYLDQRQGTDGEAAQAQGEQLVELAAGRAKRQSAAMQRRRDLMKDRKRDE